MSIYNMEEEKNKKRKSPIDLDWDKLLPPRQQDDDEPPPILVVTTISGVAGQPQSTMGGGEQVGDELETMPDLRLEESITRGRKNYETLGPKLPDKGQKLLASIRRLEEENERRKRRRLVKVGTFLPFILIQIFNFMYIYFTLSH